MKTLFARRRKTENRRDVITFKVRFSGMTEEDYEFLLKMAEDIKARKATEKETKKKKRKA